MVAEEIIYTQEVQTAVDTALDLHGQFYYQLNFQHNGSPQETDAPAQGKVEDQGCSGHSSQNLYGHFTTN